MRYSILDLKAKHWESSSTGLGESDSKVEFIDGLIVILGWVALERITGVAVANLARCVGEKA